MPQVLRLLSFSVVMTSSVGLELQGMTQALSIISMILKDDVSD